MKVNYLAVYDRKRSCGVYHKIVSQLRGLELNGIEVQLTKVGQWVGSINVGNRKIDLPYYNWLNLKIDHDVDALYIRYQRSDLNFIRFLRRFKKERKKRKVIIEIACYPYEQEDAESAVYQRFKDRIFRNLLRFYVDRIVTFSEDSKIWGIRTIQGINGVDFTKYTLRDTNRCSEEVIHMVAVASMKPWHGYDRMIEGMNQYFIHGGERKIKLHLVGNGTEIPRYKELVQKYHLEQDVFFYGQKEGKELDEIYDRCDIGIGSLRMRQIKVLSSLKTREYAAKGLPMVNDIRIDIFPEEQYSFVYRVPADETPIDMQDLITWYDKLYGPHAENRKKVAEYVRHVAEQKCSNRVTMQETAEFFKTEG